MPDPSEDQKLANERTNHLGTPRKDDDPKEVPKESFEGGEKEGRDRVERERLGKAASREGDVERA